MRTLSSKWLRWGVALIVLVLLSVAPRADAPQAAAQAGPHTVGIVCTMGNRDNGNPIFTLSTRTGYILLPDGNTMFMWGYSEGQTLPTSQPRALRQPR
ncbi:MAG: hypothetical protein R2932_34285 [Caldilineaceae bacterium]